MNIHEIVKQYPRTFVSKISTDENLMKEIQPIIDLYHIDTKFAIYCYVNDISPVCKNGNTKKLRNFNKPLVFCGKQNVCQCNRTHSNEARQQTKEKHFGNPQYNNRIKASKTMNEKYGVEHYSQAEESKTKIKQFWIEKYGVHPSKIPENRELAKNTMNEKYGVDHYSQTQEYKNRVQITNQDRYGVYSFAQLHMLPETLKKLSDKDWLIDQHHNQHKSMTIIANELSVDQTTISMYLIKYNIELIRHYGQSLPEMQIIEYIQSKYQTRIIPNIRTIIPPREIDIWLPEFHLGIEFNGKYWHHPDRYNSSNDWVHYHQSKENECKSKGINLLHLWEDIGDHHQLIDNAVSGVIDNSYDYDELFKEQP